MPLGKGGLTPGWVFFARTFALFDIGHGCRFHTGLMDDYGANRVPGHTFFFSVRLAPGVLLTDHVAAFGEAIRQSRLRHPFHVDAWVALPDHAHAIWTLPPGDHDCAARWRAVKIAFSKSVRKASAPARNGPVWEREVRQLAVEGAGLYRCLVDRVHADPLRHGLCTTPADWPWSSVHRFLAAGWNSPAAGGDVLPWLHSPTLPSGPSC